MYYDSAKADHEKSCREKYEELKKFIQSKDENGKLSDWFLASEHIIKMESEMEEMEKKLEKYRNFFNQLDSFLPRRSSIYDIIG